MDSMKALLSAAILFVFHFLETRWNIDSRREYQRIWFVARRPPSPSHLPLLPMPLWRSQSSISAYVICSFSVWPGNLGLSHILVEQLLMLMWSGSLLSMYTFAARWTPTFRCQSYSPKEWHGYFYGPYSVFMQGFAWFWGLWTSNGARCSTSTVGAV